MALMERCLLGKRCVQESTWISFMAIRSPAVTNPGRPSAGDGFCVVPDAGGGLTKISFQTVWLNSQIDYEDYRCRPHEDYRKQHRIGKEQTCWIPPPFILMNQVQVTKDAE